MSTLKDPGVAWRGMVFLASAISLIPLDTLRSILPVIATNPVHSI